MTLHPQFWWYLSRATGITAWVAASLSLLLGLALATRTLGRRPRGPWLLDLHRGASGVAVVFTALHVVGIVADSYVHFGLADVVVPMASQWRPAAVAGGVLAMWLLAAVQVTSLLRSRLPRRVWHGIHLTSYLAAFAATAHAMTAGTDAGNPGFVVVAGVTLVGAVFMTVYRLVAPRSPARTRVPAAARARLAE